MLSQLLQLHLHYHYYLILFNFIYVLIKFFHVSYQLVFSFIRWVLKNDDITFKEAIFSSFTFSPKIFFYFSFSFIFYNIPKANTSSISSIDFSTSHFTSVRLKCCMYIHTENRLYINSVRIQHLLLLNYLLSKGTVYTMEYNRKMRLSPKAAATTMYTTIVQ